MSSMMLVGPIGRDQSYVSTGCLPSEREQGRLVERVRRVGRE